MRTLTADTKIRLSEIKELKNFIKDKAAPEGTVHHWSKGDYIKQNGKWVPLENGKEKTMATTGKQEKSLTQKYFEKHYNGKVPKTEAEIKQFIKDIGANVHNPKGTDYMNRITKRGLEVLKSVTGGNFKTVMFTSNPEIISEGTAAQIIRGMPGVLMINPNNEYWADLEKRNEFVNNFTSTKNIYHAFFHEEGHEKVKAKIKKWEPGDRKIAEKTSKLSKISPEEFCSEFYAKKKYLDKFPENGTISDEEIRLYEKYGGRYEDL